MKIGTPQLLAECITTRGSTAFTGAFWHWLQTYVSFDEMLVLAYRADLAPRLLHKAGLGPAAEATLEEYLSTAYVMDPVYTAHLTDDAGQFRRLRDLAPDRFRTSSYYRSYYSRTGHDDELALLVPLTPDGHLALSLFRQSKRFTHGECARLQEIVPVIAALMLQHWPSTEAEAGKAEGATAGDNFPNRIASGLKRLCGAELTERQAEIIALILRGHSTLSVSLNLGISAETVKVHRRNIYARLGISSQAELFALAMECLAG